MVNFYKNNGVPSIQFASGQVVTLSDDVTVTADNSTNQIVISEFNQVLFWINANDTLQVSGSTITGTTAQKAALIAPVFQVTAQAAGTTDYNALSNKPFTDLEVAYLKSLYTSQNT